ncbi:MAG: hypothetical protein GVY15_13510 [Bacteroidetes bacterium]|jgi:hypothetical protein|nr:hypothetical protein [Bacteroidota bacterium]
MSSNPVADRISALTAAAADWREPDHPAREDAVSRALAADNQCTAEALAFTINQRMHTLTGEALTAWAAKIPQATTPQSVVLVDRGVTPLATFHLWIALVLAGHNVHYHPPKAFPALLPAIATAVGGYLGTAVLSVIEDTEEVQSFKSVIAKSTIKAKSAAVNTKRSKDNVGISIAIVGTEPTDEVWEGLAEDALLYDGAGDTAPRLLFAPATLGPDAFLDACAHFRAVYPAHRDTPGRLKMQQAMLEALNVPHGYSDDLGFLVSKGEAEIQSPGHIRWVPYTSADDITSQLPSSVNLMVVADGTAQDIGRVTPEVPVICPGTAHRPPVEGHLSTDRLVHFLESLDSRETERQDPQG